MHGVPALLDAQFSLAILKVKAAPVHTRAVIRILQDTWGCPKLQNIEKRGEDGKRAGDHGLDEIARQEKALYEALTEGQKEAYRALKALVDELYEEGFQFENFDPFAVDTTVDAWKAKALADLATHPAKAYMLGQMLASEKLKKPIHRPMLPTDGRAIQFLQHHTFNEISAAFEDLKGNLRTALINGVQEGANPREVARKLANELDDYTTQWDVVAITETARAESQGRLRELEDAGEKYCIGSSAHDTRTCDKCLLLIDGKRYKISEVMANTNYGKKADAWVPCIPLHPRCRCVWLPSNDE